MITPLFARGLGVTALTVACMLAGFHVQEGMLRERLRVFGERVDAEVELALAAKERRVLELERRVAEQAEQRLR